MTYINEIKDRINKIIELTRNDKINWTRINPTTYQWLKQGANDSLLTSALASTRVTLQKIEVLEFGEFYTNNFMFKITTGSSDNTLVFIDTSEEAYEELSNELENLCQAIQDSFDKQTLKHIDSLLK